MKFDRLLVLIDAGHEQQPALERAAWLARSTGASLHLLLCTFSNGLDSALFIEQPRLQLAREKLLDEQRQWLDSRVATLRAQGISVETNVIWSKQTARSALEQVDALQPDLLFKSAQHRGLLKRLFSSNSDWDLLRHCPVPLWLVKNEHWQGRQLCAALDPLHSADKPASLDHQLIRLAGELGSRLDLARHYLHSYAPLPRSLVFDLEMITSYEQYSEHCTRQHREAFEQLLGQYPDAAGRAHLIEGQAEQSIPAFVHEQGIDLLLMGAMSRSQLDAFIIGNTAERVLDEVECDLLVVKPTNPLPAE